MSDSTSTTTNPTENKEIETTSNKEDNHSLRTNKFCYPSIENGEKHKNNNYDWKKNWDWWYQEKIDGSQFTFSVNNQDELKLVGFCRGKEKAVADNLFGPLFNSLQSIIPLLDKNFVYHGECVLRPRQNVIQYQRIPLKGIILFDIEYYDVLGTLYHFRPDHLKEEANRLGLEAVPTLGENLTTRNRNRNPVEEILELVTRIDFCDTKIESCLGGPIEGVVLKCPDFIYEWEEEENVRQKRYMDLKLKFVTRGFQELHSGAGKKQKDPKKEKLPPLEVLKQIGEMYNTEARILKGIQRVRHELSITREELPTTFYLGAEKVLELLASDLDHDLLKEHREEIVKAIQEGLHHWSHKIIPNLKKYPQSRKALPEKVANDPIFQDMEELSNNENHPTYTPEGLLEMQIQRVCFYARGLALSVLEKEACSGRSTTSSSSSSIIEKDIQGRRPTCVTCCFRGNLYCFC